MRAKEERNEAPVRSVLKVAGSALAGFLLIAWLTGRSPEMAGNLAGTGILAAVVEAGWAHQSASRWTRAQFIWRFLVLWLVATILSAACTPASMAP